ncbi:MAG: hypothetical protein ACLSX5_13910 [Lachnospiraceae bacterium]
MVLVFTEMEKKQIEGYGMTVVQFKHNLKIVESMSIAVSCAWNRLMKLAKAIEKICCEVCKKFNEAIDDIRLLFEEVREGCEYPVSRRYKVVKILSKCTGLEKKEVWKMMCHIRLARSCC